MYILYIPTHVMRHDPSMHIHIYVYPAHVCIYTHVYIPHKLYGYTIQRYIH